MSAVRRILKHVSVGEALRRRKCYRNQKEHSITKGEAFLLIKEGQMSKNYCATCAADILDLAKDDLNTLTAGLFPPP